MDEQDQSIMALFEAEAHSFVLRIWRENRDDPEVAAEWRGWIDHVQSGQRAYFRDLAEIDQIIAARLEQVDIDDLADQVFMPVQMEDDAS